MRFQLKVVTSTQTQILPIEGIVSAIPGASYTLVDSEGKAVVETLVIKRKGNALEIEVDEQLIASIDDFYATDGASYVVDDANPSPDNVVQSMEGNIVEEGIVWQADEGFLGLDTSTLLMAGGGILAIGGIAAASGGSDSSEPAPLDDTLTPPEDDVTPPGDDITVPDVENTVTIVPAAGMFQSEVQIDILDQNGNKISGEVTQLGNGQYSVVVTDDYQGPILVTVTDINGAEGDYIDEVTGALVSLGDTPLRAMSTLDASGNAMVTVSPISELAVRLSGIDVNNLSLTADDLAFNELVGGLFGIDSAIGGVVTVLDENYSGSDGVSSAEAYGNALAMLSGLDSVTGSVGDTLTQLMASITLNEQGFLSIDDAGLALLDSGMKAFAASDNGDKASLSNVLASLPDIAASVNSINISEIDAGVDVVVANAAVGDVVTIFWGSETHQITLSSDDFNGEGHAVITVPSSVINAAGGGDVAVSSQINDDVVNPAITIHVDNVAPTISSTDSATSIEENSGAGQVVYSVTTSNDDGTVYSLKEELDQALFSIDAVTGEVTLLTDPDFESDTGYSFTVIATDSSGNATEKTITLGINDVDDTAPVASIINEISVVQLDTFGDSSAAQVTGLANTGEFVVAWVGMDDSLQNSIYVQQFAADGTTGDYTTVLLNSPAGSGFEQAPQVSTIGAFGDYVVVFSGIDSDGDSSIFVQQFTADGTTGDYALVQLEATGVDSAHDFTPQVLGLGDNGEYVVTWRGKDTDGDYSIFVQQFNSDGTTTDFAPVQLEGIGVTGGFDSEPQISATGDAGEYTVTWQGTDTDGDKSIFSQQFMADGTVGDYAPAQHGKVADVAGDEIEGTQSVAISNDGSAVNYWVAANDDGVNSIYVQKVLGNSAEVSISLGDNVSVQSTEAGTAYLVHNSVVVTDVASITGAADNQWNSVAITLSHSTTALSTAGLAEGTYQLYTVDALGNVSEPAGKTVSVDDSAPVISSEASADVDENVGEAQVVYTAASSDLSSGITYQLKDELDSDSFTIQKNSGEVSLIASPDHESTADYSFTVIATDALGNSTEQTVSLQVNDLDESAPVVTSSSTAIAIDENSGAGQVVYTATATDTADVDDATDTSSALTYQIKEGLDASDFTINEATGEVTLIANPDFENKESHSFTIVATDVAGNSTEQLVNLAINNIDDDAPSAQVNHFYDAVKLEAIGVTNLTDSEPQITSIGDNGGFVVTWTGYDDDGGTNIYVQQFDVDGLTSSSTVELSSTNDSNISNYSPQISEVGSSGNYVVTWSGEDSISSDNNDQSLYVQQFNADGTVGDFSPVQLEGIGVTDEYDGNPQVTAIGDAGEYVITWQGYDNDGDFSIFVQKFNADGSTGDNAPVKLEGIDVNNESDIEPQVTAISSGGEYVVTWQGEDSNNDGSVFVQQFNSDGSIGDYAPVKLEATGVDNNYDYSPQVSMVGNDGGYVVTWSGEDNTSNFNVYVQQFNADGTVGDFEPVKLEATDVEAAGNYNPQITNIGDNGEYVVTWYGEDSDGDYSINVQQFNADGTLGDYAPVQLEAIDNESGRDFDPQVVAVGSSGEYVVVWQGEDSALDNSIFVQKFNSDGTVGDYAPVQLEAIGNTAGGDYNPQVTALGEGGEFVVTWSGQDSDSDYSVFVQKFAADGTLVKPHTTTSDDTISVQSSELGMAYLVSTNVDVSDVASITSAADGSWNAVAITEVDTATLLSTSGLIAGQYQVYTVDAAGNISAPAINPIFIDDTAPIITSDITANDLVDNSGEGQLVYTATATDEASKVTYELKDELDADLLSINRFTGEVSLIANPDAETKTDYSFTVIANDAAGNSSEQAVSFSVNDADDSAPVITSATTADAIDENSGAGQLVYTATATDTADVDDPTDASDGLYYQLKDELDASYLTINAGNGEVTLIDNPDFESKESYSFTVLVSDLAGNLTEQQVMLDVNNVDDDAPTATVNVNYAPVQLEAIDNTYGYDSGPQITSIGSEGSYVVTWYGEDADNLDNSIYVQQFSADGSKFNETIKLEATGVHDDYDTEPQISALGTSGEFVVTWSGEDTDNNQSIFVQQFNSEGVVGDYAPVQLEATGVNYNSDYTPQVTSIGSEGDYVVTWEGYDSNGDSSIFVQQFNSDGTVGDYQPVQLEAIGNTYSSDRDTQVTAIGSEGEYVVTWRGYDSNSDYSIFVQQFTSDGTVGDYAPVQLEAIGMTNSDDINPQVTSIGSNGEYVVTWSGDDSNYDNSIFVQQFNSDGTVGDYQPVQLEAIGRDDSADYKTQITAIGNDGEYVVTWYGLDSNSDYSIFVQQFNSDGTTDGLAPVQLEATGVTNSGDYYPQISAIGSEGAYAVTWSGYDSSGDSSIFVQQFNADGTLASPFSTNSTSEISVQSSELGMAYIVSIDVVVTDEASITNAVDSNWNSVEITEADTATMLSTTGLADGQYQVYTVDAIGNISTPALNLITIENSVPVISSADVATDLDDNSGAGQVVYTAIATDEESAVTYQLKDELDADALSINSITGEVSLVASPDAEIKTDYSFTFIASDAAGNTSEKTVSFTVNDIDDSAPMFTSANIADAIDENSGAGQVIYTAIATDTADSDDDTDTSIALTYQLKDELDASNFTIDADSGEVTLIEDPDFENKESYSFTVVATDAAGNSTEQLVNFDINNEDDDAPTATVNHNYAPVQLEALGVTDLEDYGQQITAIGTEGQYVVTWTGEDSEGDYSIFVQQFDVDGTPFGDMVQLEAIDVTDDYDYEPQVTSLGSNGEYVVTWRGEDTNSDSSIFVQQFNSNGTIDDYAPVQLEAIGVNNKRDYEPQVAAIGTMGEYAITWSGEDTDGDDSIFVQQFNSDGTLADSAPVQLEAINRDSSTDRDPQITAIGSDGEYVVTWEGYGDNYDYSIFVQQFASDGTVGDYAPVQLQAIGVNDDDNYDPQITSIGSNGEYVVVWEADNEINDKNIYVQQFNNDGTVGDYLPVQLEVLGVTDDNYDPQVSAIGATGQYVVAWEADDSSGDRSIFVQHFNSDGTTGDYQQVQLEAIDRTNSSDRDVQITAIGTDGEYVVTWEGYDSTDDYSIFVQQFNADGTTTGYAPVQLEATGVTNGGDYDPQITAIGTDGGYAVTWQGYDSNGDYSVFVQQFSADGTLAAPFSTTSDNEISVQSTELGMAYLVSTAVTVTDVASITSAADTSWNSVEITEVNTATMLATTGLVEGQYQVYTVDALGNISTPAVNLITIDNTAPIITSDNIALDLVDNSGAGQVVYTAEATDETTKVSYQLKDELDSEALSINSGTGDVRLIANPDAESKTDYSFTVIAIDAAGNTSEQTASFTVSDVDDSAPVITSADLAVAIDENSGVNQVVYTATATDTADVDDATDTSAALTYQLKDELDGSSFSINASSGEVTLIANPDFESKADYSFIVVATDIAGNASEQTVTLDINDLTGGGDTPVAKLNPTYAPVQLEAIGNMNSGDFQPQISAIGANGEYVVTWYGEDNSSDTDVFVQQFNSDGSVGDYQPVQLNGSGEDFSYDGEPQISAVGSEGEYVVTWQGYDTGGDTSVFVQQFNSDGTVGDYAPVQLEAIGRTNSTDYLAEVTAIGSEGEYVVTWQGYDSSNNYSIFVQQFNSDGTIGDYIPVQLEAIGNTSSHDYRPQISSVGTDGGYAVTWYGRDSNNDDSIFVQQFNSDGTVGDYAPVQLEAIGRTTSSDSYSQITSVGSNGEYVVTWQGYDSTGDYSIFVQQFNADGTVADYAPVQLEATDIMYRGDYEPQVTAIGTEGNYVVTWRGENNNYNTNIYVQQFDSDGTVGDNAPVQLQAVGTNNSYNYEPQITEVGSDGEYVVTWTGSDSNNDNSIYVQQFNNDGSVGDYALVKLEATGVTNESDYDPQVTAIGTEGEYVVTWSGTDDNGDRSVFVQQFTTDGVVKYPSAFNASDEVVVQSNEVGMAYLVNTNVVVANEASIISVADNNWNSVAITAVNTNTLIATSGLVEGTYQLFTADNFGNISAPSDNLITIDNTPPMLTSITPDGDTSATRSEDIVLTFSEDIQLGNGDIRLISELDANNVLTFNAADQSQLSVEGNTLIIDPLVGLSPGTGYQVEIDNGVIEDLAGNAYQNTGDELSITIGEELDTSTVVFDLVEGVSSDHSERMFDADVAYNVIVRVDLANVDELNTEGGGDGVSWGQWTGASNLDFGDDDTLIFVDNLASGTSYTESAGLSLWNSSTSIGFYLSESSRSASISVESSGELDVWEWASTSSHMRFTLWEGNADMPSYSETVNVTFRSAITAGVLTSQGLVGIV